MLMAGRPGSCRFLKIVSRNRLYINRIHIQFRSGLIDFLLCAGQPARKVLTGGSPKKNSHAIA